MTNYREILRLNDLGISKQDIAAACECSRNTVASVLKRAAQHSITWAQAQGRNNKELAEKEAPGRTFCFCRARPQSPSRNHKIKCCCEADFASLCFFLIVVLSY